MYVCVWLVGWVVSWFVGFYGIYKTPKDYKMLLLWRRRQVKVIKVSVAQ